MADEYEEPQPIYFWVSSMRRELPMFAVPVHVLSTDRGWMRIRGLAGRWKGGTMTVVANEVYGYVPSYAKLVPGSKDVLPPEVPELAKARALRKRLRRELEERGFAYADANKKRSFQSIERIAKTLYPKNPRDHAWRFYFKDRDAWMSGLQTVTLLFSMLDMVLGAAERSGPCIRHSDCARNPELGAACKAEGLRP